MADIQQASEESTPLDRKIRPRTVNYPQDIRDLIQKNIWARQKWQMCVCGRYAGNKSVFNRLNNKLKRHFYKI